MFQWIRLFPIAVLFVCMLNLAACGFKDQESQENATVPLDRTEEVPPDNIDRRAEVTQDVVLLAEAILRDGLTCDHINDMQPLSLDELLGLRSVLIDAAGMDGLIELIENREMCSGAAEPPIQDTPDVPPALGITGMWTGEDIEEVTGNGGYMPVLLRDSLALKGICGANDVPDYPADFIAQVNVPNAYMNMSKLRVYGTNVWASCAISDPSAARVYSDNDIRMCVGYWQFMACNWVFPHEIRFWLAP